MGVEDLFPGGFRSGSGSLQKGLHVPDSPILRRHQGRKYLGYDLLRTSIRFRLFGTALFM